jgi:fatty-acyl-CoA synthase
MIAAMSATEAGHSQAATSSPDSDQGWTRLPFRVTSTLRSSLGDGVHAARVFQRAGLLRPVRPDKLGRSILTLARWGATPAAGFMSSALHYPDEPALSDELGTLTFEQIDRRTNALARALSKVGIGAGDGVAVMCRDHRGFIDATIALSKLGANALYLNTAFAGPQITEVVRRERPGALIYDEEFADLLREAGRRRKRFVAWHDEGKASDPTLDELIASSDDAELKPPSEPGRVVILTSGTTGTPKGAQRQQPGLGPAVSLLSRIPLRARETTVIAAPLFHSWGFAHFSLGLLLSSTYVLGRRFDPEATLAAIERHRATTLVVVPVMLQRILELPDDTRWSYDTSSLRVVAVSGAALPGELAERFMDEFGEVLYNLYGSTEVAWATIATPDQLRAAPGTAGTAPRGTTLKILDEGGRELPPGSTGRIFVANELLFEGYTGGGGKQVVGEVMSTGDVGHLDEAGRLFVEGRDDEMIVSGGENVFPREVEDLLARHEAVAEVAVIGVKDEQFGQRLKAFVVKEKGADLTADEVKTHVKSNLARFKVPREVEFISQLPRNATGKVLKRELV